MKTLSNPADHNELLGRLSRLRPDSKRQWGKMSAHQMVCHLADSYRGVIGEKPLAPKPGGFARGVQKWLALYSGVRWPHGVKTQPEMDQQIGGTPPVQFEADMQELHRLGEKFLQLRSKAASWRHPFFPNMTEQDWMRWAYLHIDHHLRQFGQ